MKKKTIAFIGLFLLVFSLSVQSARIWIQTSCGAVLTDTKWYDSMRELEEVAAALEDACD